MKIPTLIAILVGLAASAEAQSAWINEFHYDDSGTDQGEFIEVAYPAGTDTSAWTLYLYNRANVYGSKPLTECTTASSTGGIALTYCDFATNGLQNGGRDAIALVDDGGSSSTVLDFVSYEGSRGASSGPAAGLTPVDIGVQETSSTPAGFSLQKTGTGCTRDDFTWVPPATATKGSANTGQTFTCTTATTDVPTSSPTDVPTIAPTDAPTSVPTMAPTDSPTRSPTQSPTSSPTQAPTNNPTTSPADSPTSSPTDSPTALPVSPGTATPTAVPTTIPTVSPTSSPTQAPVAAPPATPDAAWINEFHYDNASTDVGEFVEIAYTSGINIAGYTLVFYNGNGGLSYRTESVPAGTLVGSLYLSVINSPGIQNGAPDGMALVDASGSVVEFLSYEGSMTASNGPANGLQSTNIGVSESGSTPVGDSLQRTGTGCAGSDFTWLSPSTETKGAINTGQSLSCGPPPPTPAPSFAPTLAPTISRSPVGPVSNTGVKVMAYNILAGGVGDPAWKDIVKGENPDIVVFTEVGNWDDSGNLLLTQNVNEFNAFFSGEAPYVGSTVQGIGFANSANAIMTRYPIVQTTQLTDAVLSSDSAHDLMVWKLDVGGGKFVHVIGIHLKCCGGAANDIRRNNTMKNLIAWIDASTNAADGVMLMGDFNAVSPVDTVPSFLGYQSGFEPASGSSLNDGPLRMLLDPSDPDASGVHTFQDAFRTANPTCGSDPDCCADTLCDATGLPSGGCPERGYTYVGDTHNFDSRIDFIMINQNVLVTGAATAGDVGGTSVCTASDHIAVDAIVSF